MGEATYQRGELTLKAPELGFYWSLMILPAIKAAAIIWPVFPPALSLLGSELYDVCEDSSVGQGVLLTHSLQGHFYFSC